MDLPKVEGTQIRGRIYHLNLRIKPEIKDLHGGKTHLRGSLRTSDPEVARREVERRRAQLHEQEQQRARQGEVDEFVAQLSPEKRAAYEAAGGLEGLLEGLGGAAQTRDERQGGNGEETRGGGRDDRGADTRPESAPWDRASGSTSADGVEARGWPLDDIDEATPPAPTGTGPVDDDWPLGSGTLAVPPETVPDDAEQYDDHFGDDYEDDAPGFTIADLFEGYAPTLEADKEEAMRHIVRLFTEFHGPVAFDELTIEHLDEFAEAIRQLPADMMAKLSDGTYVRDLPFAEMIAWTVHADARPISETARFQYVALLKELMFFGVPAYRRGDPWSDYRLQLQRRETTELPEKKPSRRFSPSDWTLSDAMMRLLEVAIVIFVALVFILLWQTRT